MSDRIEYLNIDVYGVNNVIGGSDLMIEVDIIPKELLSDEYSDLHNVLFDIFHYAKSKLQLYAAKKMSSVLQRFGSVCRDYYSLADFNPTPENFDLWISSLSEPMKSKFKNDGFDQCKGVLNYRRFVLESDDIGFDEYLQNHLSPEDYQFVSKFINKNSSDQPLSRCCNSVMIAVIKEDGNVNFIYCSNCKKILTGDCEVSDPVRYYEGPTNP